MELKSIKANCHLLPITGQVR